MKFSMLNPYIFRACEIIVTRRPISRQCPKYAHPTVERVLEKVFSMWSAPCPVLGNGQIDTHSNNRRGVFYVACVMLSAGNSQ
jgi:hypothetical protein